MSQRTVLVSKLKLKEILALNKKNHIDDFNEALKGYKSNLIEIINKEHNKAKDKLEEAFNKAEKLKEEDIQNQDSYFKFTDGISFNMLVPQSFEEFL